MKKRTGVVKIAISLPRKEADYVEALRKRLKTTRSAVIRDAIREKVRKERIAEMERRHEEGYRLMPETDEERMVSEAFLKAWAEGHEKEEW